MIELYTDEEVEDTIFTLLNQAFCGEGGAYFIVKLDTFEYLLLSAAKTRYQAYKFYPEPDGLLIFSTGKTPNISFEEGRKELARTLTEFHKKKKLYWCRVSDVPNSSVQAHLIKEALLLE